MDKKIDVLDIKILRGPNYWSNYHKKLIVLKINLNEFENLPTNRIENFNQQLTTLIPSLAEHHCSYEEAGGFIKRLEEGTWLGHVIEHVALELQALAGMDCGFGRTRSTIEKGVYNVVFAFEIENAGMFAGLSAAKLVETLANGGAYSIHDDLKKLTSIYQKEKLGPSTQAIVLEAKKRGIPYTLLDDEIIMLGQGANQKLVSGTITSDTSLIGADIAADKALTKQLLATQNIPVPYGIVIENQDQLETALEEFVFPIVIKPLNGNHGRGVTTNINNKRKAILALLAAKKIAEKVIIEEFLEGDDFRFLVINYQLAAVAKRTPASVIGTGRHTINELIDEENNNPKRGDAHENDLTKISIDEKTNLIFVSHNVSLDTILPEGQVFFLKDTANISAGGTAEDVTTKVHPDNIFLAERIARLLHLDICGIDIIAKNISLPLNGNGCVVEVNAGPGFRMHLNPSVGEPRNVAKNTIDMLFPANKNPRIPLVAVTGTNGKTTVVRLIAQLAEKAGYKVGFTTTDGIYIDNVRIVEGDCSGPISASKVLRDPLVNFAVLETARGGILRAGLAFDHCDISIVTNISEDHLGLDGIHTVDEMARVKSVVPRSTFKDGYAILNADDDLVYEITKDIDCHIALFSLHADNHKLIEHCNNGGLAAYLKNNWLIINKGNVISKIVNVADLPVTFYGAALCMIKNLLPVVLTAVINKFDEKLIQEFLQTAPLQKEDTIPGRMNLFNFSEYKVLIDYAHNPDAFLHLKYFFDQQKCSRKIGIIAGTGDRRDVDIQQIGEHAANIFDEIIIRHDKDGRGRTNQQLTELLMSGIKSAKRKVHTKVISDEDEALAYVLQNAMRDSFIFYFPENILEAVDRMRMKVKQKEETMHP